MDIQLTFFLLFAAGGILSAVLMITRRNPIVAAIYLILNFFCLAGLYLTLNAQFIAIIQILVYAGAIMVLVVFVIMLLNLGDPEKLRERWSWKQIVALSVSFGLLMEIIYIVMISGSELTADVTRSIQIGTVEYIGNRLFTTFLFPFEITSLLLTAAIVGAIVLAKKKID